MNVRIKETFLAGVRDRAGAKGRIPVGLDPAGRKGQQIRSLFGD